MNFQEVNEEPLGREAFDRLADEYAAKVEAKAHNAYYEKPATLSLLPDVEGCWVLGAGFDIVICGFILDRLLEPLPTKEFEKADPHDYVNLMNRPGILCIRAVKRE